MLNFCHYDDKHVKHDDDMGTSKICTGRSDITGIRAAKIVYDRQTEGPGGGQTDRQTEGQF